MEGAGFAFGTTNMDFSDAFTTMPQPQQQSFLKPSQGDTSAHFFFGDEGIDTSASFIDPLLFSNPSQEPSYMTQNLAMDNTLGSASGWDAQLTPNSHGALNSFPATPLQSFDVYQPSYGTTLGKRSLQLDAQDFPQAKRHESVGEYTAMSSFPSSAGSSLEVGVGLSDEAADVCATWFNKYAILPSDRHIESLSQLTGEPATAIRHWFGQLLKQGMGSSNDSAYKSQTDLLHSNQFWSEQFTVDLVQQPQLDIQQTPPVLLLREEETATPDVAFSNDTTTTTITASQPASTLRGNKKRCTPTDDVSLLNRDSNKIYQCTRKCGKRYGRKCDWKRNEEEGYPCKSWVCSLCTSEGIENVRPCFRKYHFVQHFRNIHPEINCDTYEGSSVVCSETEFPRNCGFCRRRFDSRQERIDHIADHFKQGKCMLDWSDEEANTGDDSDNTDDDHDKPSSDGSDGNSSYQSPDYQSRNSPNTKYYGSGDYGGGGSDGSGNSPPQGGFFQFQLSDVAGGNDKIDLGSMLTSCSQGSRKSELSSSNAPSGLNLIEKYSTHGSSSSIEADHKATLAGNALTEPAIGDETSQPTIHHDQQTPLIQRHFWKRAQVSISSTDDTQPLATPDLSKAANYLNHSDSSVDAAAKLRLIAGCSPLVSETPPGPDLNDCSAVLLQQENKISSPDANRKHSEESVPATTSPAGSRPFLSVKLLGAGGFSTVDEVLHRKTNLRVCRKTLKNRSRSAVDELRKEVNVLQKLRHPHVIRFLGAYSNGDKMSILLSPVAETTLALWLEGSVLQRPANLIETIVRMFGCLVSSVRYLHEQRPVIIHMDIKPQNILITQQGSESPHVVLSDFGTSSSDELSDSRHDQHKPLTRRYIAPEVLKGFTRKQAADIWSLGCVFSEMASVSFSQSNAKWLDFRQEYSGRAGKHYWQDLPGLQDRLSSFLDEATTHTETTVVQELQSMLSPEPAQRPGAASLSLKFVPASCCLDWPNDKAIFPGPVEALSSAEMLVQEDGVDYHAQHHAHGMNTCKSAQNLPDIAKLWLDECSQSHNPCQQSTSDCKALPTRLVDLHPDGTEGPNVRIVNSASIKSTSSLVEYVALSHVWNQTQMMLTSERFPAMQEGLLKKTLPEQLQSAVQAAQHLGYRYIWLDSLCIIQDSEDDRRQECASMASVYRNAALTIVLDQLDAKSAPASTPTRSATGLTAPGAGLFDTLYRAIDFTAPGFGWNTSAWALQERLLSRRFLHIGTEQMYWECNALKASSTFPRGLSPLVWEKVHSKAAVPHDHDRTEASSSTASQEARPDAEATRLRNCQRIKKEGDGAGRDSVQAAHTTLMCPCAKSHAGSTSERRLRAERRRSAAEMQCGSAPSIGTYNAGCGPWVGTAGAECEDANVTDEIIVGAKV